jgi:hypothetical protein
VRRGSARFTSAVFIERSLRGENRAAGDDENEDASGEA